MRTCCVPFCHQKSKGDLTRSFHEFPCKLEQREKWIRLVSRLDPVTKELWQPKDKSVVCSKHFLKTDFSLSTRKRSLKPNAVPTIFSDYPSYMQKAVQKQLQKRKLPTKRLPLPIAKKAKLQKENLSNAQTPKTKSPSKTVTVPKRTVCFKDVSVQATPTITKTDRAIQVCSVGGYYSPNAMKEARKKIKRLQKMNSRLRKQMDQLNVEMGFLETKTSLYDKYPIPEVTKSAATGSVHAQFLLEQLQVYYKNRKRVRFSNKTLEFCHTWKQYCSSRSYEYVRRVGLLELPSRGCLARHRLSVVAAQEAAEKQKDKTIAAQIDEAIENVVKSSYDETTSSNTELVDGPKHRNGEMITEVVHIKPIFQDFTSGQVYYVTNALVDHCDNNLHPNNIKREIDDQNRMPTVMQVFENDHCYYGAVPTITCPTDPVPTQVAPQSLLEQLSTTEVSSCGDFG